MLHNFPAIHPHRMADGEFRRTALNNTDSQITPAAYYKISIKAAWTDQKWQTDTVQFFSNESDLKKFLEVRRANFNNSEFKAEVYVPPVLQGDEVWSIEDVFKTRKLTLEKVSSVSLTFSTIHLESKPSLQNYELGKKVFKTKEEAIAEVERLRLKQIASAEKQVEKYKNFTLKN